MKSKNLFHVEMFAGDGALCSIANPAVLTIMLSRDIRKRRMAVPRREPPSRAGVTLLQPQEPALSPRFSMIDLQLCFCFLTSTYSDPRSFDFYHVPSADTICLMFYRALKQAHLDSH